MSVELVAAASEPPAARRTLRRFSPWALLVVGSLVVLVAGAAVLAAWWLGSSRTTTVAYAVPGTLLGIEVRVQSGDVTIVGGSRAGVSVTRSDHSVYGHGPREQRPRSERDLASRLELSGARPGLLRLELSDRGAG